MKNKLPDKEKQVVKNEWLLLIHQLPPRPTSLRVRIWRKLQNLGAVAVKNSVYVLPFNEKSNEDFQWLKQEIESAGGEATVFRAGAVEGATDEQIIAAFRYARDEEYAKLTADLDGLTGSLHEQKRGGHLTTGRIGQYASEMDKLHKELERIISTDFFVAESRKVALAAYERGSSALRAFQGQKHPIAGTGSLVDTAVDISRYKGRRWMTRQNLFVDRLAAIWLIKKFIDPKARFYFVAEGESIDGALRFDMFGGEFTHRGEDCTFETMIKEFGLEADTGLRSIAEIVHDLDLKDQKFHRLEAAGLGVVIQALAQTLNDDRKLARQCAQVFDGIYALLKDKDETRTTPRQQARRRRDTGGENSGK